MQRIVGGRHGEKDRCAGNLTCFYYDALHRVTDAGLSGPVCRRFRYDGATVNGVQMTNAAGRLAETMTDNCGSTQYTVEGFGYDPRGYNTNVWNLTLNSGRYYHVWDGVLAERGFRSALDSNLWGVRWS